MPSMTSARFELTRQIGGKGSFAIVALEIEPDEMQSIHFQPGPSDEHFAHWYTSAAETGIRYAMEAVHYYERVRITVTEIGSLEVDSTALQIVYAAANATWEALGKHPKELPTIELSNGKRTFNFPS
jgi:hypothetical protein